MLGCNKKQDTVARDCPGDGIEKVETGEGSTDRGKHSLEVGGAEKSKPEAERSSVWVHAGAWLTCMC